MRAHLLIGRVQQLERILARAQQPQLVVGDDDERKGLQNGRESRAAVQERLQQPALRDAPQELRRGDAGIQGRSRSVSVSRGSRDASSSPPCVKRPAAAQGTDTLAA